VAADDALSLWVGIACMLQAEEVEDKRESALYQASILRAGS
jgi:hypothetical protein